MNILETFGILGSDGRLLATGFAVVAGITYNFLPFMALPLYVSLEQIDSRLLEAAEDLYASKRQAFLRVTLPLSAPGIVAGTLLTFIPAAGDFINAQLLGTPRQSMVGNVIQSKFLELIDYPAAASLSFILMALILAALLVYARVVGTERLTGYDALGQASPAHGVRDPRVRLPAAAGRGRDPLLVQRAGRSLQLRLGGLHARQLDPLGRVRRGSGTRSIKSLEVGVDLDDRGDRTGDLPRARDRPSPLPRARRHEHPRLPADVDAGDRPRRLASHDVPPGAGRDRVRDDLHRPRDVHRQLRRRDREGAADRLRPPSRGGGDGPRGERVGDLQQGDAAAARAGDPERGAARVRALDRRLRDHVLRLRADDDVPALRLGRGAASPCRRR